MLQTALLPSLTCADTPCRPINRILVAQKITHPQAVVSMLATLLHLLMNYVFIETLGWGPVSVAWALSFSNLCQLILMLAYLVMYRRGYCVWGEGLSLQSLRVSIQHFVSRSRCPRLHAMAFQLPKKHRPIDPHLLYASRQANHASDNISLATASVGLQHLCPCRNGEPTAG